MTYKEALFLIALLGFTFPFVWVGQMLPWLLLSTGLTMSVGLVHNLLNDSWEATKDRR
jgi:hypothetical protein